MKKIILPFILFIVFLTGCSKETLETYPSAFRWADITYGISSTIVSSDQLGENIGEINCKQTPFPLKNGDSNTAKIGSKIFEIKNLKNDEALAIEIDGTVYKAYKLE